MIGGDGHVQSDQSEMLRGGGGGAELHPGSQAPVHLAAGLSSHISKLEEYYGVRLFDRGIPMTLTDAGRALQKHAREILSSVDDYAREVQDIKNFRQGELTVGIPVTRGTIMLPPLLSAFHQLFPQIRLHLVEGTVSGNIADALYDGTADLCIGYQPKTRRSWR